MKNFGIKFTLLLICISCLIRSISWTNNYLNIDELGWIYLINRLKINPIPFSGFTAQTTGPLAIYFLSVVNFIFGISSLVGLRIFQFFICIVPTYFLIFLSLSKTVRNFGVFFFFLLVISPYSYHSLIEPFNDFLAYNTEYQIMLFLALLYYLQTAHQPSNFRIFIVVFLSFCLFFIKSQAVLYTPYFLAIYSIQLFVFQRKSLLFFGYSVVAIVSTIFILLNFFGIWDEFLFEYLYKNFVYANVGSFSILGQIKQIRIVWFDVLIFYWAVLIFFLFLLLILGFKGKVKQFYSNNLLKSTLLFLFSLGIVFVSSFNFNHYKVLLFFPMTIFVAEIYNGIPKLKFLTFKTILIVLSLGYLVTYRDVVFEVLKVVKNKKLYQYQSNIGQIPALAPPPFWNKGLDLNVLERKDVDHYISKMLRENSEKNKVYIFGWFIALGYYYNHIKDIRPISKSCQTQHLMEWYWNKDFKNFVKEESNLLYEFEQEQPDWIVDAEGVLKILKNQRINKYICEKYSIVYQSKNFIIFKLKKV